MRRASCWVLSSLKFLVELVLRPLLQMETSSLLATLGIFVDTLDECVKESDVRHILQLLRNIQSVVTCRLRIFVTDRDGPSVPPSCSYFTSSPSLPHHHLRACKPCRLRAIICALARSFPTAFSYPRSARTYISSASAILPWSA